jgi:hypothetical protein
MLKYFLKTYKGGNGLDSPGKWPAAVKKVMDLKKGYASRSCLVIRLAKHTHATESGTTLILFIFWNLFLIVW